MTYNTLVIIIPVEIYVQHKINLSFVQVLDMINNPYYLYRMTILRTISLLAPVMGSEITYSKLLPVIVTLSKDR